MISGVAQVFQTWKNEYVLEYEGCSIMLQCGGFASAAACEYRLSSGKAANPPGAYQNGRGWKISVLPVKGLRDNSGRHASVLHRQRVTAN